MFELRVFRREVRPLFRGVQGFSGGVPGLFWFLQTPRRMFQPWENLPKSDGTIDTPYRAVRCRKTNTYDWELMPDDDDDDDDDDDVKPLVLVKR